MHISTPPSKAMRGHQILRNWGYRLVSLMTYVLGIEFESSASAANILNHWASISPAPECRFEFCSRHPKIHSFFSKNLYQTPHFFGEIQLFSIYFWHCFVSFSQRQMDILIYYSRLNSGVTLECWCRLHTQPSFGSAFERSMDQSICLYFVGQKWRMNYMPWLGELPKCLSSVRTGLLTVFDCDELLWHQPYIEWSWEKEREALQRTQRLLGECVLTRHNRFKSHLSWRQ